RTQIRRGCVTLYVDVICILHEASSPPHAAKASQDDEDAICGEPRAKGLVNAILRRFLRERESLAARMQGVPRALYSHPPWLIDAFRTDWPDAWRDILDANNRAPPLWVRVNLLRTSRDEYLRELEAAGLAAEPSPEVPSAVLLAEPVGVDA